MEAADARAFALDVNPNGIAEMANERMPAILTEDLRNDFMRRTLRGIGRKQPLDDTVTKFYIYRKRV